MFNGGSLDDDSVISTPLYTLLKSNTPFVTHIQLFGFLFSNLPIYAEGGCELRTAILAPNLP